LSSALWCEAAPTGDAELLGVAHESDPAHAYADPAVAVRIFKVELIRPGWRVFFFFFFFLVCVG